MNFKRFGKDGAMGVQTEFTSIDDQAGQVIEQIRDHHSGKICCAYGLSLGGKILSRVLERNEVTIEHSILDGYKSVYTNGLESIPEVDIHFWYGTKEAFVAKAQVKHLKSLCPKAEIKIFKNMNHGQLLIDRPEEVASLIDKFNEVTPDKL